VLISLFHRTFRALNKRRGDGAIEDKGIECKEDMFLFCTRSSNEEVAKGYLLKELSLFWKVAIEPQDLEYGPLEW
jgi:hypothetical protein